MWFQLFLEYISYEEDKICNIIKYNIKISYSAYSVRTSSDKASSYNNKNKRVFFSENMRRAHHPWAFKHLIYKHDKMYHAYKMNK